MKKLNVSFINNGNKEDAILKIKDDSFTITTNDNSIIKIPFNDVNDYEYTQDEKLIIKRKHNSDVIIEVSFDIYLINTLKKIIKQGEVQTKKINLQKSREIEKMQLNDAPQDNKDMHNNENILNNIQNNNQNHIGGIIGYIVLFVVILAGAYYFTAVATGDITNMKGCYIIDDILESDVSLCFNGSTVKYSYHGSTATFNVKKIDNSVYITNEYDDYMFTCDISSNDSNRMKCSSYNKALGIGDFYFEKE